jgi:transcriptional regulator GlxA family with amidase domain
MTRRVGIFVFDQVEALDLAGPYEVFTTAARMSQRLAPQEETPYQVAVIGRESGPIATRAGLKVVADRSIGETSNLDVLVIPGGIIDDQLNTPEVIEWVRLTSRLAEVVASVCTGAFILAKAGLLDGRTATTHWEDAELLSKMFPQVRVVADTRWVDEGQVVTSAGISAGIDMSLHLVARLNGHELAARTARQMDYRWQETP